MAKQQSAQELQDSINKMRKEVGLAEIDFSKLTLRTSDLRKEFTAMSQLVAAMSKDLKSMADHIEELVQGADNYNNIMKKTRSAVSGIEDAAEKLYYHQEGVEKLSASELKSLNTRLKTQMKMVDFAIKQLQLVKDRTKKQEQELETLKKIKKLSQEIEAASQTQSIKEKIKEYTSLKAVFGFILSAAKELDAKLGKFAKNMNMSYQSTVALAKSVSGVAQDIALPNTKLLETYAAIGNALRSNALLNKQDLKTFTELREKAGLTNEELVSMQQYTFASGGNLKSNLDTFLQTAKAAGKVNGVVLNEKQLLQETSKVNKAILAQFTAMPESLGRTVAKAAELGTNLDGIEGTAKSLMNFEDSISKELEAQALTGRAMNLDAARFYALTNQTEKLTEEIANHFVDIGEWNSMTRLGQESYAASLGKSREEMAQMVFEATSLKGLSEEQANLAKQGYDALVKQYGVQRANEIVQKGGVDALVQQQSMQDRFNNSIETLKETMVLLVEGPLGTFVELMARLVEHSTTMKIVLGVVAGILAGRMVAATATVLRNTIASAVASTTKALAEITAAEALTLGIGTISIVAGIATAAAAMYSAFSDGKSESTSAASGGGTAFDDAIIGPAAPSSGRSRILMGKEGVIGSFNDKDTITASTKGAAGVGGGGGGNSSDVVAAIKELQNTLTSKPTEVYMDTDEVTYKIAKNMLTKTFTLGLA